MSTEPNSDTNQPTTLEISFKAFEALVTLEAARRKPLDLKAAATWLDVESLMTLGQTHVVNPVESVQFGIEATIIIRAEKDAHGVHYVMTMFDQIAKKLVGSAVVVDNECVANAISAGTSIIAFALKENSSFLDQAKKHLLKGKTEAAHSKAVLEGFIEKVNSAPVGPRRM